MATNDASKYASNYVTDDTTAVQERAVNYKNLLNAQIQNANAQRIANKYMANALKQSGLQNTGVGVGATAKVNNNYLNNANNNVADYNSNELQITSDNATRWSEEQASKDATLISAMQTAYSSGDGNMVENLLKNNGYIDDNGNWTSAFYSLDADRQSQLQNYATLYRSDALTNSLQNSVYATDLDSLRELSASNGQQIKNFVTNEAETLANYGGKKNGDVYQLKSKLSGNYTYILYNNGRYYIVDEDTYNKATNKYLIKGSGGKVEKK